MPVVRVYLPVGGEAVRALAESGGIVAGPDQPLLAFAVTPELAALAPGLDEEALEYSAFTEAVAAAEQCRERPHDRRVVIAADADPAAVEAAEGPAGAVRLVAAIPLSRVASFHVDEVWAQRRRGSVPDGADSLLWYDVTELAEVRSFFA
jgi:hypothetical protein